MPALSNPKEEALAQTFVTHPEKRFNKTQSYLAVNPEAKYDSARSTAPEVFAKPSVQNRIRELLEAKGLGLAPISDRLGKWVFDDEHPAQSMDAIKTAYKLHGVLDSDEKNMQNPQEISVNVNIIGTITSTELPKSININQL